ncbi:hypothetical protein [Methanosarcina mazei]|jgi:hypothetical protein|uniref:Uncharacterized protein n=1 Tax=Methanosarcina mazei TaxID=2209 RepID=A0A0F8NEZ3_METMZ|nr:hypothetical protein [Methanosarcina mazei]KKH23109.1 hypothetical protein DU58_16630 [Methanosarcina mazei]
MVSLWNEDTEIEFFTKALLDTPSDKIFYNQRGRSVAYWEKNYNGSKSTLQSRNSLIGDFTEKWTVTLLKEYAQSKNLYVIQGVICEEIGLTSASSADAALCKTNSRFQRAEDIVAIFEVKMSIVWNWEFDNPRIIKIGDYSTHQGNPGLLRSDSMLKAIGKSINIRVSGESSRNIPIIVLGNTPITESYYEKVDNLKSYGIIQGFWSVNPNPRDGFRTIKNTEKFGFIRMDTYDELVINLDSLLDLKMYFFASMTPKTRLGTIIEESNREYSVESKAERFIGLLCD